MSQGCVWDGEALIAPEVCEAMLSPTLYDGYGWLWWLEPAWVRRTLTAEHLDQWRAAGVEPAVVEAMHDLKTGKIDFRTVHGAEAH